MNRIVAIPALVSLLLLAGCTGAGGNPPGTGGTPASAGQTPSEAATEDETVVADEPLPVGLCGQAPAPLSDQRVYQGSKETDCGQAMDALTAFGRGEDSVDESGHGTMVDGWSCVFPMDNEIVDYAITLSCEKGGQRFVLRPDSVAVPAGYAVLPWDYEGTATGAAGIYFTTESRKHHCSFTETELGCDNFNFPDDLPPVRYMGQPQQPTAIVLEAQGSPRFEVYGDPTFTQYSDSGEWGADTRVLGYGEVLWVRGIACTTDPDRGVVCTNGQHGFEISSKRYAIN